MRSVAGLALSIVPCWSIVMMPSTAVSRIARVLVPLSRSSSSLFLRSEMSRTIPAEQGPAAAAAFSDRQLHGEGRAILAQTPDLAADADDACPARGQICREVADHVPTGRGPASASGHSD